MRLFSTDIDGTIYDGPDSARKFHVYWEELRGGPRPPLLAYNTGRSLDDTRSLVSATGLPAPDYIIGGVGTEIYDSERGARMEAWDRELSGHWNFDTVERIVRQNAGGVEMQPEECQNPFKCSWFWFDKDREHIDSLSRDLRSAGIDAQVVYSSDRDLDILPARANKGNAVEWLSGWCDIPPEEIVVAGDSGNDASMFQVEGVTGILVLNAEPALPEAIGDAHVFRATLPCADGVIEGLRQLATPPPQQAVG